MDVKSAFAFSGLVMLLLVGCGKKENDSAKPSEEKGAATTSDPSDLLVGTWYGRANLNPELLEQKLNNSPTPGERAALQNMARVFQTTEIGAQFGADGTMTLDIQIQPGGQVLRDSTSGSWRLVETDGNAVIVETTESLPAGGTETNRVRYQFEQDGQLAIMVAPTSDQLADCQPVFVFERVVESSATVADRAASSSLK